MPLHTDYKGPESFDCFDCAVHRARSNGLQLIADPGHSLMVAGVYPDRRYSGLGSFGQAGKAGARNDGDRMSFGDVPTGRVIYRGLEMLDERAAAPHVHR